MKKRKHDQKAEKFLRRRGMPLRGADDSVPEAAAFSESETLTPPEPEVPAVEIPQVSEMLPDANKELIRALWRGYGLTEDGLAKVRAQFPGCPEAVIEALRHELGVAVPEVLRVTEVSHADEISEVFRIPEVFPKTEAPMEQTLAPRLKIDWGTGIRADVYLTPEFFLSGLPYDEPPIIYFPPDSRMNREFWETFPRVRKLAGAFYFDQKLIFDRPGKFVLELVVIQSVPGLEDPLCWKGTLRMTVCSPDQASRSVTIEAETFSGMNLGELGGNITIKAGNVVMDGSDDGDFNRELNRFLRGGSLSETDAHAAQTQHLSHLELEPAGEDVVRRCPYISSPLPRSAVRRLVTLVHPGGALTRIIPGGTFQLGRNSRTPQETVVNDVDISLVPPRGADEEMMQDLLYASGLFSRAHAQVALDENGLWLHDIRSRGITRGLFLEDELIPQEKSVRLDPEKRRKYHVSFARLLDMEMELHGDDFSEKYVLNMALAEREAFLQAVYQRRFSFAQADFLRAQRAGISSVMLRHLPYNHALAGGGHMVPEVDYLCEKMRHSLMKRHDARWLVEWEKRFRKWLSKPQANPRVDSENYLLLLTQATLGGSTAATLRFTGRGSHDWNNTLLRIWNFDHTLYLECLESVTPVTVRPAGSEEELPLRCFRPIPITRDMSVRCGLATFEFRVEEV